MDQYALPVERVDPPRRQQRKQQRQQQPQRQRQQQQQKQKQQQPPQQKQDGTQPKTSNVACQDCQAIAVGQEDTITEKMSAGRIQHPLGNAESTKKGKDCAIELFDHFQVNNGDPCLADLNEVHVSNENMLAMTEKFAKHLVHDEIKQKNNTGRSLSGKSRKEYFKRVIKALKDKFPGHDLWKDENWQSETCTAIERQVVRKGIRHEEESTSDLVRAIYRG